MLKKVIKGFTLIELMIVVAIIGILAAIAVPNFVKFQCRSKQSEAKGNLKSLYVSQESYRAEFDAYQTEGSCKGGECSTYDSAIGWQAKGQRIRYDYSFSGTVSTFAGVATPNETFVGELDDDKWTIDHNNNLANAVNGCN